MRANFIQFKLVLILLDLVVELQLQIAVVVLEGEDLLTLLEDQRLELTDAQAEVLLSIHGTVAAHCIDFTVAGLEAHLLFQNAELVQQLILALLHLSLLLKSFSLADEHAHGARLTRLLLLAVVVRVAIGEKVLGGGIVEKSLRIPIFLRDLILLHIPDRAVESLDLLPRLHHLSG